MNQAQEMEEWAETEAQEKEEIYEPVVQETYNIPLHNMGYLMEKIDKLNKKATKLGCDPISVEKLREYDKNFRNNALGNVDRREFKVRYCEVKVFGKAPKFAGWTFLATIEHEKASKNLIKTIPGIELDHYYRSADPNCEHCHTKRWRKKTYVLKHEGGKEVQVGSTCIKDFLGHKSPDAIAWQCAMLGSLGDLFGEYEEFEGGGMPRAAIRIGTRDFFKLTAQVVRESGWVSKSKAYERPDLDLIPTVEHVDYMLFPPQNVPRPKYDIQPGDVRLAYKAKQWAESLHPDSAGKFSDYFYNIKVLANDSSIGLSEMGLAASIVGVFKGKQDKEKMDKGPKKLNEHFGEIKTRYDLELTVKSIAGFDGQWGHTTIYKMQDRNGRKFSWFSTSKKIKLLEGTTYKCKATVKAHKEWKDSKETMLTRLSLKNN